MGCGGSKEKQNRSSDEASVRTGTSTESSLSLEVDNSTRSIANYWLRMTRRNVMTPTFGLATPGFGNQHNDSLISNN